MLVCGFIRETETETFLKDNQIIPADIISLCEYFYYSKNNFIYLLYNQDYTDNNKQYQIYMANLDNNNGSFYNKKQINISKLPTSMKYANSNHNASLSLDDNLDNISFYFAQNVILPTTYGSEYDAIFKSNSSNYNLEAILINRDTNNAFNYILPNLPINLVNNTLIHSYKYGLFSIGGYDIDKYNNNKIYNLPAIIDKNKYLSWKWNDNLIPNLDKSLPVYKTSGLVIRINHQENIFICGGVNSNYVRLYNLESDNNNWNALKPMNKRLHHVGICFDKYSNSVYIADQSGYVSYYNFNNKWFDLPPFLGVKYKRPLIWKSNTDVLFVASANDYMMKYIDLRSPSKLWQNKLWKPEFLGVTINNVSHQSVQSFILR